MVQMSFQNQKFDHTLLSLGPGAMSHVCILTLPPSRVYLLYHDLPLVLMCSKVSFNNWVRQIHGRHLSQAPGWAWSRLEGAGHMRLFVVRMKGSCRWPVAIGELSALTPVHTSASLYE